MKIAIAADHAGLALKEKLRERLADYPHFACGRHMSGAAKFAQEHQES